MKLPRRRRFLHLAAGAAALPFAPHVARAQTYPTRPVTMVVPFAAGGTTDFAARAVSEHMSHSSSRTCREPGVLLAQSVSCAQKLTATPS